MSNTTTTAPTITAEQSVNGDCKGAWLEEYNEPIPNLDDIITQDHNPVDNVYVEKLYHLLTSVLFASWQPPGPQGRRFVAMSNFGWFFSAGDPALVPDVLLSLDVTPRSSATKLGRSYFQWILGKQPDLAIEIVSDKRGDEYGTKMQQYANLGLPYYVIHDPESVCDKGILNAFQLHGKAYTSIDPRWIEELGLGLIMWEGTYRGETRSWLRWCDRQGQILLTGEERAETAEAKIQRLLAHMRQAGIEPPERGRSVKSPFAPRKVAVV